VRYRLGEDGSREPIPGGWWDSQLQVECSFQRSSDGVDRCLPALLKIAQTAYADAACTSPVSESLAPVAGCASDPPTPYGYKSDPACASTTHIYGLGPSVAPATPRYYITNGACIASGAFGDAEIIAQPIGAEIPAASFVGATGSHD
jgi:hypothetical protein